MKVKFANKVFEVLYTMEAAGLTMYAVEDEPNHIDWLTNVEVVDADKKELKKIEQKPVNDTVETIVEAVSNTSILDMIEDKDAFTNPGVFENSLGRLLKLFEKLPKQDLLDGLKFYANVVKHDGEYVKPTWSDEDEEILKNLIDYFSLDDGLRLPTEETIDWLKSLKERLS